MLMLYVLIDIYAILYKNPIIETSENYFIKSIAKS